MSAYHHLTAAQLRELRRELEHELAWLERAISTENASEFDARSASEDDDATGNAGVAVALYGHTRTRHAEVMDALHRIDDGEYGSCMRCGGDIPYGRLVVVPEAAHCISCGAS